MNKLILLGGAVSGLALAYAAYAANTSYQLTVNGTINSFVAISPQGVTPTAGNEYTTPTADGHIMDFSYGGVNSFGDANGHGSHVAGLATVRIAANAGATYSLTSLNGTLWNSPASAARMYTAYAHNDSGGSTGAPTVLGSHSVNAPVGSSFSTASNSEYVHIVFDVPDTSPAILAAGQYLDTLTST